MKNKFTKLIVMFLLLFCLTACSNGEEVKVKNDQVEEIETDKVEVEDIEKTKEPIQEQVEESQLQEDIVTEESSIFDGYRMIEVDGGNLSGHREPNVVVDIGFGDREYWAFTNEYGQLVKVVAKEIILQDEENEPVTSKGRYYRDEAKVPGVERPDLDEGHIIADSLGGVSNAYNITPQESTLNRHGDQAYMEKVIRDAGGCTDFVALITYPDTKTQIPSHYSYTYTLRGNVINDEFDNINPDNTNGTTESSSANDTKQPVINNQDGTVVYWTPNGKSYHSTPNCSTLKRSKVINSGTIEESGKTDPCDKCYK